MKKIICSIMLFVLVNISYAQHRDTSAMNKEISCFESISWVDNIFNPNNGEFLDEILFNENGELEHLWETEGYLESVRIQVLFIERYYETCTKKTITWFKKYSKKK